MRISKNVVLVTGGATGIGFELARAFMNAGNTVIICGRRKRKLQEAKAKLPGLHVKACDLADPKGRRVLFRWVTKNFSGLNVLVNNAGIQSMIDFTHGPRDLLRQEDEIAINLESPIHLSAMFIPRLLRQKEAAIVNITSGLAFTPLAVVPVYCATKAGMHSFTLSLRHQLADTSIKVFEAAPPTTDTEQDKGGRDAREQKERGIPPAQVADAILKGMRDDRFEIVIGEATRLRAKPDQMFRMING